MKLIAIIAAVLLTASSSVSAQVKQTTGVNTKIDQYVNSLIQKIL